MCPEALTYKLQRKMVKTFKPCDGKQKQERIRCVYSQLQIWLSSPTGSPVPLPELQQDHPSHSHTPSSPQTLQCWTLSITVTLSQHPTCAYHATQFTKAFLSQFPIKKKKKLYEESTIIDPSFRGGKRVGITCPKAHGKSKLSVGHP